VKQAIFMLM